VVVGAGAMVGLNSSVIRDVQPLDKVAGCPAERLGGKNDKKRNKIMFNSSGISVYSSMLLVRDMMKSVWYNRSEA
jgi:serine acetyltransferase